MKTPGSTLLACKVERPWECISRSRPQEGARLAVNPWVIALVVTLVAFMEILNTTIVNVALPHIAGTM
jgi:hypothetical protein